MWIPPHLCRHGTLTCVPLAKAQSSINLNEYQYLSGSHLWFHLYFQSNGLIQWCPWINGDFSIWNQYCVSLANLQIMLLLSCLRGLLFLLQAFHIGKPIKYSKCQQRFWRASKVMNTLRCAENDAPREDTGAQESPPLCLMHFFILAVLRCILYNKIVSEVPSWVLWDTPANYQNEGVGMGTFHL